MAFSQHSKAGDLGHGIAWNATLGIGAALLTVITAAVGLTDRPSAQLAVALWLAPLLTVAHSLATTRAAPTNFSQRSATGDPARLEAIFDRFERWQNAREVGLEQPDAIGVDGANNAHSDARRCATLSCARS